MEIVKTALLAKPTRSSNMNRVISVARQEEKKE